MTVQDPPAGPVFILESDTLSERHILEELLARFNST
jgi:hypothetical protein